MEEQRYIDIYISKYDTIFDQWLEETGSYIDHHCYIKIQKKFDESMGLENYEYINSGSPESKDDYYRFRMIDGPKLMLAILKYNLYDDRIN